MRSKKWLLQFILSILALLGLLTACGSPTTDAPQATDVVESTPSTHWCGESMEYDEAYESCVNNIATFRYEHKTIIALVEVNPNPVNADGTTALTLDIQVYDARGNYLEHAECYYDGHLYTNPTDPKGLEGTGGLIGIDQSQEHGISCDDSDDTIELTGKVHYFLEGSLAQTLTALPPVTATSTMTETPAADSKACSLAAVIECGDETPIRHDMPDAKATDFASIAFWSDRVIFSTSADGVIWGYGGDSGVDPNFDVEPDETRKTCTIETKGVSKRSYEPCNIYYIDPKAETFFAPGLLNVVEFGQSKADGGPLFYYAIPPTETPAPTSTPTATRTATSTFTPTLTNTPTPTRTPKP